ncbi:hypothetical protein BJ508DRAFT_315350 [Ascobolus immersus RN42]|uniref:Uncharacterized protein n=1 Tax=Ascobolus immersus RN42 TaxID=1160509 RepID=A0A3N4HIC3_ASCIM|nr:hypothetical protein BJ508DRAFT_315350 [Ascobolus immersus RN42]
MAPAKSKGTITFYTTHSAKKVHNYSFMPTLTSYGQAASRGTAGTNFTITKRKKPKPLNETHYLEAAQQELPDEFLPNHYSGRTNNIATITKHGQGIGKEDSKYTQKIYSDFIPSVLNQVKTTPKTPSPKDQKDVQDLTFI